MSTMIQGSIFVDQNGTRVEVVDAAARQAAKNNAKGIDALSAEIAKKDKPLVYIDGVIPTTKDNVLATMTVKSSWLNIFAYIKIKCQGTSSMRYPKKNFTVTLYQDAARTIPLMITIPGWKIASNKFVLKANWIDHLHARNVLTARIWSEIVASRPDYDALPEELRNSPNNGAVDGFPVIGFLNGAYSGIYTWNIGKDAWMWNMDEDNPNHVLMCAETNTDGVYAETPCNFRALWGGVDGTDWSIEVGTNSDAVKNSLNALIACVKDTTDEEFVAQIETHLDIQSAIDYYIFSCANCGIDNLGKNMLLATYDLEKWYMGAYDLDSTWGMWWDGTKILPAITPCPGGYQERYSLLFARITSVFADRLVDRGLQLRKTALSIANINTQFEHFAAEIGTEAYADDIVAYPDIPSAETSNIWQIRNFVASRLDYFDAWLNGMAESDEYDVKYPLARGMFESSYVPVPATLAISAGNHVEITTTYSQCYSNLSQGAVGGGAIFTFTDKLFDLKAGDVVTVEMENIVATGGKLTTSLITDSGEVSIGTIDLSTVEDNTSTVTNTGDMAIGSLGVWFGGVTAGEENKVSFNIFLYVNGERYM